MTTTSTTSTASEATAAESAETFSAPIAASSLMDLLIGVATQSWLASMVFHMALMIILALVLGTIDIAGTLGQAPEFEVVEQIDSLAPEITHFEVGYTPLSPSEL